TYTWNDGGTHTYSWSNQGSYSNTSWTTAGGAGTFAYSGTITYAHFCAVNVDPINQCFPDASLADAVASVQGKLPTATFTSVDQAVTSLNLNAKGILSLEGIANL
ncbi:hypothetical protein CRD60_08575, partial [Bifidobacterium aemilianum]